jgi:hypothetical protein
MRGRIPIGVLGTALAAIVLNVPPPVALAAASSCTWWGTPQPVPVGSDSWTNDVAVLSRCNAWAVGGTASDQTLIEHWNGRTWSVKKSPNVSNASNQLTAVVATSPANAWAVGYSEGSVLPQKAVIEHWDGSAWTMQATPHPGNFYTFLEALDASSATNAWALGLEANNTSHGVTYKSVVYHWNGSKWRLQPEHPAGIGAIATLGPKAVWVAGGSVIQRWTGTAWRNQHAPVPPSGVTYILYDIMARATNDVWAVGYRTKGPLLSDHTLIEHWNGVRWRVVKSPNVGKGDRLGSVVATSQGNAWAVGNSGVVGSATHTLVLRWKGTAWSVEPSMNLGTDANDLRGVDASSSTNAWAVGTYSPASGETPLALHCCG